MTHPRPAVPAAPAPPAAPGDAAADAAADAFRRHPGLRDALAAYCAEVALVAPAGWPINKLFNQLGRYLVGYFLIHHHRDWARHGGPLPTLARLQQSCPLSPRQTAGIVAGLRAGRLVETRAAPAGRARILVPAPAVTEQIAASMLAYLRAVDRLQPACAPRAPAIAADPQRQDELVYRSAAALIADPTLLDPYPRVVAFARRDCGYLVLAAVMAAVYAVAAGKAPPSLSYRRLADHFRLSRSHIGNLLGAATRAGWITTDAHGRLVAADPAFVAEFERWSAWQLAHHAALADAILADRTASA